jgi:hypothetical protein
MQEETAAGFREEPKFPIMVGVGLLLLLLICVAAMLTGIAMLAQRDAVYTMVLGLIVAGESAVKIALAIFVRAGRAWAYYLLLVWLCVGMILVQMVTLYPPAIAVPFLLFVLLISNYKGYLAFAEYHSGPAARMRSLPAAQYPC